MKAIHIGKMNKKIYIMQPIESKDNMGQDTIIYKKRSRIWATVRSVRGGEYYEALKRHPEVSYIIYVRYRTDIHADTVLNYKGKLLEVKYVADMEEERKMLEIQCIEYQKKEADICGILGI